jgi:hypothetical protein
MNGCAARRLSAWIARAASSLPVPVSPVTSTVASPSATRAMRRRTSRMGALSPISAGASRCAPRRSRSAWFSRTSSWRSMARRTASRSSAGVNGRRAVLHRLDRRLDRRVAGDHDDGDVRIEAPHRAQHIEPRHPGHLQVDHRRVVRAALELVQRVARIPGGVDTVALGGERLGAGVERVALVVHEEHGPACAAAAHVATGSST